MSACVERGVNSLPQVQRTCASTYSGGIPVFISPLSVERERAAHHRLDGQGAVTLLSVSSASSTAPLGSSVIAALAPCVQRPAGNVTVVCADCGRPVTVRLTPGPLATVALTSTAPATPRPRLRTTTCILPPSK